MYTQADYKPHEYVKYKFKTEPFEHQKKIIAKTWMEPYYALFLEQGLGKTFIIINTAGVQFLHGLIDGLLVIAPKGVYRNWTTKEIPEHMPEYIKTRVQYWVPASSQGKKYKKELDNFLQGPEPGVLDIFAVNIDALITEAGMKACTQFLQTHATMAVVDESTRIKNHSAQRTKNVIKLSKLAKYKRILTGTPISKSPLDLYSQCDFLKPSVCDVRRKVFQNNPLGFANFYTFRSRYAILKEIPSAGGHAIKFPVAYVNQEELNDKLKDFSIRLTKKDCLDLPEKIYQTWDVDLTPAQSKYYKQMITEARITLDKMSEDGGEIYAQTALTQLLRLHQLSCGFITTEDKQVIEIENNRLKELLEVVETINLDEGKVIIWSHFVPAIEKIISALREEYGDESVVHFYGATPPAERERAKKDFQDPNSPVKFFVANPSSAGMGITLTQATTVIYYSNSFNLEYRLQSEDRAHRAGQKKAVTYIDFVSTPIDAAVIKKLVSKKLVADLVIDGEIVKWIS